MSFIREFLHDEEGATAIEYGLIAALVSVFLIGTLTTLGERLDATFQAIIDELAGGGGGGGGG